MSTSQDKTAQQILASAVEVRELPAQESDPGRRQGCLQGTLSDEDKKLTDSQEEQNCCILYQGSLATYLLAPGGSGRFPTGWAR